LKDSTVALPESPCFVQAASCSELSVVTVSEAALLLQGAVQRRSVAATALNAHSLRSHALVVFKVRQSVIESNHLTVFKEVSLIISLTKINPVIFKLCCIIYGVLQ
jgi:hypothetical protein